MLVEAFVALSQKSIKSISKIFICINVFTHHRFIATHFSKDILRYFIIVQFSNCLFPIYFESKINYQPVNK